MVSQVMRVHCGVLVRDPLRDRAQAGRALDALTVCWPEAVPTKTGGSEPLPDKVVGPLGAHVASHWSRPFIWQKGRKATGSAWQATLQSDLGILSVAVVV